MSRMGDELPGAGAVVEVEIYGECVVSCFIDFAGNKIDVADDDDEIDAIILETHDNKFIVIEAEDFVLSPLN